MNKVLFEITEDQLETGLRGFPCGYCTTSYVDPTKGLFYAGKALSTLATKSPEEVLCLLYFGREPSDEEKNRFLEQLNIRSGLSPETIRSIESLPRKGHPMKLFSAALLILGMTEGKGDYREDCLNIIATRV